MSEVNTSNDTEWIEQWREMKKFGDWLIQHGISCAKARNITKDDDKIFEQRVGLALVHQATEILMKSYLVKENKNITRNGRRTNKGREITISFMESIKKINKSFQEKGLESIDVTKFGKFDEIRNEIYHRSFEIPWDKDSEIHNFLVEYKKFYESGFEETLDIESESMMLKFKKIHSKKRTTLR